MSTPNYRPNTTKQTNREKAEGLAVRLGIPLSQAMMLVLRPNFAAFERMALRHNAKAWIDYQDKYTSTPAKLRPEYIPPFDPDKIGTRWADASAAFSLV